MNSVKYYSIINIKLKTMKFFALIGMATAIKVEGDWWGGDSGIID